jgi:5'-3' exonuclease
LGAKKRQKERETIARMPAPVLLLDGASMWFRSYFGVPSSITAPDGRPVNAVRGFIDSVATVITQQRPHRLAVCLDLDWRPQFRVDLIPSYKAHRVAEAEPEGTPDVEEVPDDLTPQVDMIMALLDAFGIPAAGAEGFEADDVLGTLAAREPGPTEVASGDRDLFQLIDDDAGIRLLYCGRGVAKLEVCDDAAVRAKYGVPAAGYADFAAMRGDPSDGLPGVPGVGEKTAARLVHRYGSLDAILATLDDPGAGFAPGVRAKIAAARDYLAVAPKVVAVARDVPLPPLDTTLPAEPAHPDTLLALAEKWSVAGPVRRLVDAISDRHPSERT